MFKHICFIVSVLLLFSFQLVIVSKKNMYECLIYINTPNFQAYNNVEYDGYANINLQHSLNWGTDAEFTERGNVTIQSLRLGQSVVNQKPLSAADRSKLVVSEHPLLAFSYSTLMKCFCFGLEQLL